eukprot:4979144-Amphidinium_carterae.1
MFALRRSRGTTVSGISPRIMGILQARHASEVMELRARLLMDHAHRDYEQPHTRVNGREAQVRMV